MIASFGDKATEDLYHGRSTNLVRKLPQDILDAALIKMDMIKAAAKLIDLKSPPGNQLEVLKGGLNDLYSIRVNRKWRLVFKWQGTDAYEVKLVDYH